MAKSAYSGLIFLSIGLMASYFGFFQGQHEVLVRYPSGESLSPDFRGIEGKYFQNSEGLWIHYRNWSVVDVGRAKGLVFCSHGASDHSAWFEELAMQLAVKGYLVYAHDHQGFGRSEGDQAFVVSSTRYSDDFLDFIHIQLNNLHLQETDLPIFAIGESLGGLVVLDAAIRSPQIFRKGGIVSIAAPLDAGSDLSPHVIKAVHTLSQYTPKLPVLPSTDASAHFAYETISRRYTEDHLTFKGYFTLRWVSSVLQAVDRVVSNVHHITTPLLVIQGDEDRELTVKASQKLHDAAKSKSKTIKHYPGLKHYALQEKESRKGAMVDQDVVEWIVSSTK